MNPDSSADSSPDSSPDSGPDTDFAPDMMVPAYPNTARQLRSAAWDSSVFGQRWYWLTPLFSIVLFVAAMLTLLWVLRDNEIDRQRSALIRDVESAQQVLRRHLESKRADLTVLSREIGQRNLSEATFAAQARQMMTANPEIVTLAWVDANSVTRWNTLSDAFFYGEFLPRGRPIEGAESVGAFFRAKTSRQPTYSRPYPGERDVYVEMHIPIFVKSQFMGTLVGAYSINNLLRWIIPREISQKHKLVVVNDAGVQLATLSSSPESKTAEHYELPFDPPGSGMQLRAYPYPIRSSLTDNFLVWVVVLLSAFIIWSLWSLMRHTRRRIQAESARDRLFNLSLDILCVMDSDGTLLRLNPAFTRVLGLDPAHLQGTSLLDIVHPDDRQATEAELGKLAAGEPSTSFENRCRRINEDGAVEYRWLVWAFNPDLKLRAANRLLYAVAHDVTLRRTRQQALMAETAFRRAMEDSMLTGMRAFDLDGRITYVNPAFCRMIGWDEKELIGALPPYPYWPESMVPQQRETLSQILSGHAPASGLEVRVMRKDASHFDARMYVSPLIDAHGMQTGWMTSMTDITEPKRIREELAAAQERFTTVLEELDAAVSVYAGDVDENSLLFANRYYRRVLGSDAAGHRELSLQRLNPGTLIEHAKTNELYSALADRWFEVRQRTIQWVDGRMVQMQVATDITARRQAEQLARQQEEKLQLTSRLMTMGEMASSLAHELNQPLTAIANYSMGSAARVRSGIEGGTAADPAELLQILQKTSAQAERAGKIIRRIREFVKRSEPRKQRCKIRSIVDDAVGFAEIEAATQRISIRVLMLTNVTEIDADPILIEQVLLNLLKNGAEAMYHAAPHHSLTRALMLEVRDTGSHIEFAVADRGPGIDPASLEKLFEPFFSTKSEGMGMGLNICRSIIEFHHGRLWVENNPGGGCTFRFTLPKIGSVTSVAQLAPAHEASAVK